MARQHSLSGLLFSAGHTHIHGNIKGVNNTHRVRCLFAVDIVEQVAIYAAGKRGYPMVEVREHGHELLRRAYDSHDTAWLAFICYSLLVRPWFIGFDPLPDMAMTRFLISVYFCYTNNSQPPSKKTAIHLLGVKDIKTARKYIAEAVDRGYIEVLPSKDDRRVELLYPSELLKQAAKREVGVVGDELRYAMDMLASFGANKDKRARSGHQRSRAVQSQKAKK